MTRRRRRLLTLLVAAIAVVASLEIGRRWVVDYVIREVDSRLTALNGGPISVARHVVRLRPSGIGVTLHNVGFLERSPQRPAWLTAETIEFPLTAADLFAGRTDPREIDIDDLRVQLELNDDGQLMTDLHVGGNGLKLPADRMAVRSARFELRQQGRDTLVADRVEFVVNQRRESLAVAGTIGQWLGGAWSLDMQLDGNTLATTASLSSDAVAVDSERLARLPLVPPAMRESLRIDGTTAVSVAVERPPAGKFGYQIALTPAALAIDWPQLDLALRNITGSLVVSDGRVTFSELRALMAGARVRLGGHIDLWSAAAAGQVRAGIEGLSLASLPAKWTVPSGISGTVSSQFDLSWRPSSAGVLVRGGGRGTLDDARIAGLNVEPIQVGWQLTDPSPAAADGTGGAASSELALELTTEGTLLTTLLNTARVDPESLGVDSRDRISASGQLRIPLATAADLQTYRGEIRLALAERADARHGVRRATADIRWKADDTIASRLDVQLVGAGHLHAEAATVVGAKGRVDGQVACEQIPVAVAGQWLGFPPDAASGSWSAEANWSVPLPKWRTLDAWRGRGRLAVAKAQMRGEAIADLTAGMALDQGQLTATEARAVWRGGSVDGEGTIDLKTPFRFKAQVRCRGMALEHVVATARPAWPHDVTGTAAIGGQVTGTLRPWSWQAGGQGEFVKLVVARLPIGGPQFLWQVDSQRFTLTDVKAQVAGGTVELNLSVPRDEASSGKLQGRFTGLHVRHITDRFGPLPVAVTGPASGDFAISNLTGPSPEAEVRVHAAAAVVRDIAVQNLEGQATYRKGKAEMEVRGTAFDGNVLLRGNLTRATQSGGVPARNNRSQAKSATLPTRLRQLASDLQFDGQLSLRAGRLERMGDALGGQPLPRLLTGIVDIQLNVRANRKTARPEGVTGRVEFRDVRWDGKGLLQQVSGQIELADGRLRLSDIEAQMVGGRASAEVSFAPAGGGDGTFAVRLERLRARRLLAAWPKLARQIDGKFDLQLEGKLGRRWRGTGQVQSRGGQIAGVPMQRARVPLRWDFVPARGSGRLIVQNAMIHPIRGQIAVDLQLGWGDQLSVDGRARLQAIDVRDLTGGLPNIQSRVTGLINGQLTLAGRNVRSLDDLTGTFKASLGQSHILSLPVFNQLVAALVVGQALSPGFETSTVEARLARGTISIQRLTLVGSGLQLLIRGHVTTAGRLDLDVTADTGQLSAPMVACRLLVNPGGFLRRRLVFLHVSGSVRTPIVQIRPLEQLDQEIRIFFLL